MVLVLILCIIIIIIMLAFFLIIFSTINIEIKHLELSNVKRKESDDYTNSDLACHNLNSDVILDLKKEHKVNQKYNIVFSVKIFNKLRILNLKINNQKLKNIINKLHLNRLDIKKIEKEITPSDIKQIAQVKPKIVQMDLKVKFGVDDILLTTYAVPILSTIISVILPYFVEKESQKKIKYEVEPIYNKGMIYNINIDVGVNIKTIRILNVAYAIYKRKKLLNI